MRLSAFLEDRSNGKSFNSIFSKEKNPHLFSQSPFRNVHVVLQTFLVTRHATQPLLYAMRFPWALNLRFISQTVQICFARDTLMLLVEFLISNNALCTECTRNRVFEITKVRNEKIYDSNFRLVI